MQKKALFLLVPLVLLLGVLALPQIPALQIPEKYDLLGKIKNVQTKNDRINDANTTIAGNMSNISNLSDTTKRIGEHLHTLSAGLAGEDQSLQQLDELSQEEIDLSISLHEQASILHDDLAHIQQASASQKNTVAQMTETGKRLSATAKGIEQTNATAAGKVEQAARITGQVANDMP